MNINEDVLDFLLEIIIIFFVLRFPSFIWTVLPEFVWVAERILRSNKQINFRYEQWKQTR